MSLASARPMRWNEVIGQDRVVSVIHSLLRNPHFMPRGLIFEGPRGVGKTSSAYLMARALMCLGDDPLGCMECPSCITAVKSLSNHPAFTEVDAASCSGVKEARELMAQLDGPANLGKRHVVVIDEAHQLSTEAWDVFLKPLDLGDLSVIVIFCTTKFEKIPETITSRCGDMRFSLVSTDALTGALMRIADSQNITYTYDGLKAVARHAHGRLRDAAKNLGIVAAGGAVTKEAAEHTLNHDAGTIGKIIYLDLLEERLSEAIARADELAQRIGPVKVIETLFSLYSRDVFAKGETVSHFSDMPLMTAFFLKWTAAPHLPADIMPLFIIEFGEMRSGQRKYHSPAMQAEHSTATTPTGVGTETVDVDEFRKMMET